MKIKYKVTEKLIENNFDSFPSKIILLILFIILLIEYNSIFSIVLRLIRINVTYNKKNILSKKILFISPVLGGGGAERVICRLASELSKKHEVYLLYFYDVNKKYFISPKVQLIKLYKNYSKSERGILKFVENIVENYKIDVIINFLRWFSKFDLNIRSSTKIIFSERGDPIHSKIYNFNVTKKAYKIADIIVFQTKYALNLFPENIKKKGIIISNPVKVDCLSQNNSTSKKIVSIGRLVAQKNQALLIKAFSNFEKSHKGYKLYIYGIGDQLNNLKKLAKEKKLEKLVHFKGFSLHIHERIKDAEFFVLSSDFEGLPNALMEAMMMGIPVISTNCSGINEIISDQEDGLLVPVNNISSLSNAMSRLSDNKTLRNKIREGGLRRAKEWKIERIYSN